jgi:hypothetical protein
MTDQVHKFKIGQTVDLVPSMSRRAARGHYQIVSLRPADGENPQYRIRSKSESHERVVAESDLILPTASEFRLTDSDSVKSNRGADRSGELRRRGKEARDVQNS